MDDRYGKIRLGLPSPIVGIFTTSAFKTWR
jgi:hypothetical protein